MTSDVVYSEGMTDIDGLQAGAFEPFQSTIPSGSMALDASGFRGCRFAQPRLFSVISPRF